MTELITTSLQIKELPTSMNIIKTDVNYPDLNQIMGSLFHVTYHLVSKRLYFIGDKSEVEAQLASNDFEATLIGSTEVDIKKNWHIVSIIFYKAIRFFLMGKGFVWKPRIKNEVFILNPNLYGNTQLVHKLFNINQEELRVHEGFRYYLDFIGSVPVLSMIPKVTPTLRVSGSSLPREVTILCEKDCEVRDSCKLPKKKIRVSEYEIFQAASGFCPHSTSYVAILSKRQYVVPWHTLHLEAHPRTIKQRGFYGGFRKIALKPNWRKRELLRTFANLLSDNSDEIVIPVGDLERGLVLDSELMTIRKVGRDFYGS